MDNNSFENAIPGTDIGQPAVQYTCPGCGAPVNPNFKFCGKCGVPLSAPAQAPISAAVETEQSVLGWKNANIYTLKNVDALAVYERVQEFDVLQQGIVQHTVKDNNFRVIRFATRYWTAELKRADMSDQCAYIFEFFDVTLDGGQPTDPESMKVLSDEVAQMFRELDPNVSVTSEIAVEEPTKDYVVFIDRNRNK